ncbi:MAG: hypothetical protein ACR2G0_03585 [Chthoniobacterales bacterium]
MALSRITDATKSGDIHFFPMTWAQARLQGREIEKNLGIVAERHLRKP